MANIPVPDFNPPRSIDLPTVTPLHMQPITEVGDALRGLGHTIGQTAANVEQHAQHLQAVQEHAQRQADALQLQDATNRLNAGNQAALLGDSTQGVDAAGRPLAPGFFSLEGTDAHDNASKALDAARKRQLDIANKLPATLRQRFLVTTEDNLLHFQGQVETHSAKQFTAAQMAAAKDAQVNYLSAEANGTGNAPGDMARVESSLREAAKNDAAGELAVRQFRGQVATTNIGRQLSQGNWGAAQEQLAAYETLGWLDAKTAAATRKQVELAAKSGTNDALQQRLYTGANAVIDDLKTASVTAGHDGFVDDVKMREDFDALMAKQTGLEPKHQQYAVNAFNAAMARQNAWERANVQGWRDTARKTNGHVTDEMDRQLTEHDFAWWSRFKDIRARKAAAAAKKDDKAAAKLQAEADKLSLEEFRGLSTEEKVAANLQHFADDRSMAADADGRSLARQKLVTMQARAREAVQKGYASDADSFANKATAAARQLRTLKKGQATSADFEAVRQQAWDEFDNFYQQHRRTPTADEERQLLSGLTLKSAREWADENTGRTPLGRTDTGGQRVPLGVDAQGKPVKPGTQRVPTQKPAAQFEAPRADGKVHVRRGNGTGWVKPEDIKPGDVRL